MGWNDLGCPPARACRTGEQTSQAQPGRLLLRAGLSAVVTTAETGKFCWESSVEQAPGPQGEQQPKPVVWVVKRIAEQLADLP